MGFLDRLLFLLFSFYFISVYSYEYIPVYMWETSKNYSPLPALGRINEEFFRDILLDKLNKDKIVLVLLEENLSPEDFTTFDTSGENVFYALSHIKSEAQVNYYPFVEAPLKALQNLPGVKVSKVDVTPSGLPSDTKIEPGQVLIVDLNDAKETEDRSHMLRRHDSLVASIYKSVVSQHENVIALYTAKHSSWLVPSELEGNGRKARHLLGTDDEPKTENIIVNDTSFLMYIKSPIMLNMNGEMTNITTLTIKDTTENTTVLEGAGKTITLNFKDAEGYWFFKKIIIEENDKTVCAFNVSEMYAPYGFSYHCNDTFFEINNPKYNCSLALPGLQLERFINASAGSFSDAYDCIGFTTAPIWSGLFVTFILAMIMTVGLCMIMDIKTMDRFDDPKGKTISINVVE